jgi:hypothetical protein
MPKIDLKFAKRIDLKFAKKQIEQMELVQLLTYVDLAKKAIPEGKLGLTLRDFSRKYTIKTVEAKQILEKLTVNAYWIRVITTPNKRGGRPTALYFSPENYSIFIVNKVA